MPTELRTKVKHGAADRLGVNDPASAAPRPPRRWALLSPSEWRPVTVGHKVRVAAVRTSPTAFDARCDNLELVTGALAESGVDHFAVRGNSDLRACVGIPAGMWERALEALRAKAASQPLYLTPTDARDRPEKEPVPFGEQTPQMWRASSLLRVNRYYCDPDGVLVLGADYGCDLERWEHEGPALVAPRNNRVAASVVAGPAVELPGSLFTQAVREDHPRLGPVRSRLEFGVRHPQDIGFPIDAVFTWVDGGDPAWMRRRARYTGTGYHPESSNQARYLNRDELRYALRSIADNAPWIRTVHLVTDDQKPSWLNDAHPGLRLVSHREIFSDPTLLPTFNSHAIESQLHHLDGLSEHFLYFNDDMFLGQPVLPQDFFLSNGTTRFFPSTALVPHGPADAADPPVSAAGKNNRALIQERFGSTILQKMRHVPYALRRSVLWEIEKEFPEEHARTAASRIRAITDLSIPSSLYHYYAYSTGRAVPAEMDYLYLDNAQPGLGRRLGLLLLKRDRKVFCLNDTVSEAQDDPSGMTTDFLSAYFPSAGPFEIGASRA